MSSIAGAAIHVERQLQFEEVTVLSQSKTNALQAADVALFPVGSFQCFRGQIAERPIHGIAVHGECFWIDVIGFFVADVEQQVALPKTEEQKTFAFRFIKIPGLWGVVIEFDDGERELGPGDFSGGFGLCEQRSDGREKENGSYDDAESWRENLFHFRTRESVIGKVYDRGREGEQGERRRVASRGWQQDECDSAGIAALVVTGGLDGAMTYTVIGLLREHQMRTILVLDPGSSNEPWNTFRL